MRPARRIVLYAADAARLECVQFVLRSHRANRTTVYHFVATASTLEELARELAEHPAASFDMGVVLGREEPAVLAMLRAGVRHVVLHPLRPEVFVTSAHRVVAPGMAELVEAVRVMGQRKRGPTPILPALEAAALLRANEDGSGGAGMRYFPYRSSKLRVERQKP